MTREELLMLDFAEFQMMCLSHGFVRALPFRLVRSTKPYYRLPPGVTVQMDNAGMSDALYKITLHLFRFTRMGTSAPATIAWFPTLNVLCVSSLNSPRNYDLRRREDVQALAQI